jgi:DNA-binding NarL/FixJ family response regulator
MKILIVEDHPMVQDSLRSLVGEGFQAALVEVAGSLAEAVEKAGQGSRPYLALLDLGLPDSSGLDTLKRFRKAHPEPRVVVLAETNDAALAQAVLQGGASGFVPKTYSRPMISAALQLVAAGGVYMPVAPLQAERKPSAPRANSTDLTERQIDVLRLIARGLRNREIGERLKITEDTVKQHARVAYAALGVSSRMEAVSAIARRGIRFD